MRFEQETTTNTAITAITEKEDGIDIRDKVAEIQAELRQSPEVLKLSKELNVQDANAILQFGTKPAEEISKFSDKILNTMKSSSAENSGVMLKQLSELMLKFDKKDFEKTDEGIFDKIFGGAKNALKRLIEKYETLGSEIDKIYNSIVMYKNELNDTNKVLEDMYNQNIEYYKMLEKYIVAGQMVIEELKKEDLPFYESKAQSGDQMDIVNLQNVKTCIEMLEQRTADMEMAKMVSLETAPQIRMIQKGNYKLIGKVQSAFVITIPVFKNGLIQAVALKRQKIVSDSMNALDEATNQILLNNAENIKNQSVDIAKLSGGTSVKIETMEKTWNTIMEGIEQTKQVEEENRQKREESIEKIHAMQNKMIQSSTR